MRDQVRSHETQGAGGPGEGWEPGGGRGERNRGSRGYGCESWTVKKAER